MVSEGLSRQLDVAPEHLQRDLGHYRVKAHVHQLGDRKRPQHVVLTCCMSRHIHTRQWRARQGIPVTSAECTGCTPPPFLTSHSSDQHA